jgi:hypothetical protein
LGAVANSANVGAFTFQLQDAFGNVTTTPTPVTVTVASSESSGTQGTNFGFATTSGGAFGAGAFSVTILAGHSTSPNFYYGDEHANAVTLTGSSGGLSNATTNVTLFAGTATKLVFSTAPGSGPAAANADIGPFVVQLQDKFGNPTIRFTTTTVTLHSNEGTGVLGTNFGFSTTPGGAFGAGTFTVTIAAFSSTSTNLYYGDLHRVVGGSFERHHQCHH